MDWKRYLIIPIIFIFTSCVSLRPGRNVEVGEKRIELHQKGINNVVEKYPELLAKSDTLTILDSVRVPIDTARFDIALQDSAALDSIENEIRLTSEGLSESLDRVSKQVESMESRSLEEVRLKRELQRNVEAVRNYKAKADTLYNLYINSSRLNFQYGRLELEKYYVDYKIVGGKLETKVIPKPQYVVYEKTKISNSISIKDNFWQDKKFYIYFLLPLLIILFFFGKHIQAALQDVAGSIVKLIRKLLIKI